MPYCDQSPIGNPALMPMIVIRPVWDPVESQEQTWNRSGPKWSPTQIKTSSLKKFAISSQT